MKITLEFLKKKNACTDGLNWFANQKEKDAIKIIKKLIADKNKIKSEYNEDYFLWANWLISRALSKIDGVKYAVFAAENVLHIFEKKHPGNNRNRAAIEAAKNFIKNPNKENAAAYAAAVYNAAAAAYANAYAAEAVAFAYTYTSASAIYDAAYAAASASADAAAAAVVYADAADAAAAADAADAVAAAVHNAYAAAAAAVDDDKLKIKIINYGIELLKKY